MPNCDANDVCSNRCTCSNGDTTYSVNLQQHGNQWFQLGTHTFDAGQDGYIEFNTNTPNAGYCNADAVWLVPAS